MSTDDILGTIADQLPIGVWVARVPGGELLYANSAFADILGTPPRDDVDAAGYSAPYGIHTRTGELYPEHRLPFARAIAERTTVVIDDLVIHRVDGRRVYVRAFARPVMKADGALAHVIVAFFDITREVEAERARAESEARLALAQRMESIGQLAGGVAHDFNNLLATIKLVAGRLRRIEQDPSRREDLQLIDDATESAVKLTRSLLGFARRGKNLAQRVSLHRVARTVVELLQRTFDRRIELALELDADPGDTVGDFSQLEQVLMNLLVNARDAMPSGGRLVVRTRDAALDEAEARRHPPLAAGRYVVLEVADSGVGIDPAIRGRIFEPYFTTKTSGHIRGSGLGLATVYGIVDSHGGVVEVEDNRPRGTVMRVYLPAALEVPSRAPARRDATPPRIVLGRGLVLVVDDEPMVRRSLFRALGDLGYDVVEAGDGVEAVEIYRRRHREIAAVMLDMVMPRMDGRATYRALREVRPDVAVVLMTGFALNDEAQAILDAGVRAFIAKPCALEELSETLGRVVGLTPPPARG